jgi:uncharacterized membrane protein
MAHTPIPESLPMATLTVWKFATPDAADAAEDTLVDLQKQNLIAIHDAATVSWRDGAKTAQDRQLSSMTGAAALSGSFWGLLFGCSSSSRCWVWPSELAAGALGGSLTDVGIDRRLHLLGPRPGDPPGPPPSSSCRARRVMDAVTAAFEGQQP